ncbi:hypothetical protein pb186bvf_012880 [Paramecium bursaria]
MDEYQRVMFHDQQESRGYSFGENAHQELQLDNQFEVESTKSLLRDQFRMFNEKFPMMGLPQFGDLFSNNVAEIEQSMRAIQSIIKKFTQDQDLKGRNQERIKQMEQELIALTKKVDSLSDVRRKLENELQAAQTKQKISDKAYKDIQDKIIKEREELQSQLTKMSSKVGSFEAQLKSKDIDYLKLKDHFQKNSMKSISYINCFDGEKFGKDGQILFTVNGDHEFSNITSKQYEDYFQKLRTENDVYRKQFIQLQSDIEEIITIRKEILDKRRSIAQNQHEIPHDLENPHKLLNQFKPDLFKTPLNQNCQSALNSLSENLHTLKELMQKFDAQYDFQSHSVVDDEGTKIKACKSLDDLFKNYNYIFEQQDKMINQIVAKTKQVQYTEDLQENINIMNYRIDDKQMDDVKKYLSDQQKYIDESKVEMDQIKKQFQNQLKKREEEKNIILAKKQMLEETNQRFKANIQKLEETTQQAIQALNEGK